MEKENKVIGRTWVDLWVGSSYIFLAVLFTIAVFVGVYYFYGEVPRWIFVAIGMSLAFIPFLFDRAKEDSQLFIVCDEPLKLSEYRVGSKVNLAIKGIPAMMTSNSGVPRFILQDINFEDMIGIGSPFAEYSQFEQIRTMTTLQSLTTKLEAVLREDRLTSMQTGLEVEKQSKQVVDWALRVIYGSSIPNELSDALGLGLENIEVDTTVEEVMSD